MNEKWLLDFFQIEIEYPEVEPERFGAKFRTRFKVGVRMRPKVRGQAHSRQNLNGIPRDTTDYRANKNPFHIIGKYSTESVR